MSYRYLMDLARSVEPDNDLRVDWWSHTGIAEFDGLTPAELLEAGKAQALEMFLQSIIRGERDGTGSVESRGFRPSANGHAERTRVTATTSERVRALLLGTSSGKCDHHRGRRRALSHEQEH